MSNRLTVVECPRDAMQGIDHFIPTQDKIDLISALAAVGFPIIDFGSYVSSKAIPQMSDTKDVIRGLPESRAKLLAIIANLRGAEIAVNEQKVAILGYPLSVSETFQLRNSNKTIVESLEELVQIQELCNASNKQLVVYLSMAFGNPYGDPYSIEIVEQFAGVLVSLGVKTVAISDTIGLATPDEVANLYANISKQSIEVEWGLHLHARPEQAEKKVKAALAAGCRRLDGAILGYGGCPMAEDNLVGNINTRTIIEVAEQLGLAHSLDLNKFNKAEKIAARVFNPV